MNFNGIEGFIAAYRNLILINNNNENGEPSLDHLPPLVKKETQSNPTESASVELLKKTPNTTPLYATANMDVTKQLDSRDLPHLVNKFTGEIYKVILVFRF